MMQLAAKVRALTSSKPSKALQPFVSRPRAAASIASQSCFLSTFAKRSLVPVTTPARRSFAVSASGKSFERKPSSKSAAAGASTNRAAAASAAVGAAQAQAQAKAPAAKAPRDSASRAPSSAAPSSAAAPPRLTRSALGAKSGNEAREEDIAQELAELRAFSKAPMTTEELQEIEEMPTGEVVDLTMPTPESAETNRPPAPETIPAWKPITTQDLILEQVIRKPTVHNKGALLKTIAEHPAYMIVSMEPEQYAKARESAAPDGTAELDESSGVSFHSYTTVLKTDVIPLFTAKNRAIGYWERCDFDDQEDKITLAEVSGFDVFATAADSNAVLFVNPYSPLSVIIPPEASKLIAAGKLDEAAKLSIAARLPEPVALQGTTASSTAEHVETPIAAEWRKTFTAAVQRSLKAGLRELSPIRMVGMRLEKLQHTQLLHPDTQQLQFVLEVVVDPPGAETEAERKIRAEVEQSGQEIPLTREELYESSVVSQLTNIVEAEESPPAGIALWVTPVKQLSDDAALVYRRTTSPTLPSQ